MSVSDEREEVEFWGEAKGAAARALILLPNDLPGGAERITMTVAEAALKSNRFSQVVVFVMSRGDNGRLSHLADHPKVRLIFAKTKRQWGGILTLLKVFRRGPYDFVFSSHLDINALASLARRLGILKTHRLVTRESTMFFERDFGWKSGLVLALYRFYGTQDLIVCQTDRMAQSLNRNTESKFSHLVRTIPNPLPFSIADRIGSSVVDRSGVIEERIAWCGRIAAVKSPLRAVETLAHLHRMGRNSAKLVMIGNGPMVAEVLAYARLIGVESSIELTGFLQDPAGLMQTCRAGLMTSDVEGFPNVILEMLSSGIVGVASTDCAGGLNEIPGVIVASENTPESLARALDQILMRENPPASLAKFLVDRHPESFFKGIYRN